MQLQLDNCDRETSSNETDPGDSLLSSLALLTAVAVPMDGAKCYDWKRVILKPIELPPQTMRQWENV